MKRDYLGELIETWFADIIAQIQRQEKAFIEAKWGQNKERQREAERKIRSLCKELFDERLPEASPLWLVQNFLAAAIYNHLSALSEGKEKKSATEFRNLWKEHIHQTGPCIIKADLQRCGLIQMFSSIEMPSFTFSSLPFCSFFLQFTFTLAKPFISKDDEVFYILENPVVKDKVFKVPYVRSTSWKGNLRLVMRILRVCMETPDDAVIVRLFGNEKGEEEKFNQGRLSFYPSFFHQVNLELINPHSRGTKVGRRPITIESVPIGAEGTFNLLYVPFDCIGDREATLEAIVEDIAEVAKAVREMMLTYGFSAKKTSGFGIVERKVRNGILQVNYLVEEIRQGQRKRVPLRQTFDDLTQLPEIAQDIAARLRKEVADG
jgi:CRISPR-associated protein Cmr2